MSQSIKDGSVSNLWRVSFPLIISFLSGLSMITVDRLFLAHYSPAALGAAVSGGMMAWAFTFGGQTVTNIAGVFVAQHNGAERFSRIAQPVWQMIWFSLALSIPFAMAGLWLGPVLFQDSSIGSEQLLYFRWMLGISPLFCLQGALNGFFIGRGRTSIITWLSLIGNAVNLALDPIFIFGWGPMPEWGMAGACIATGVGIIVQLAVMLFVFLRKDNREAYGSGDTGVSWRTMWDCIRIGSPEAIAVWLELSAWGLFYSLMADLSRVHMLVTSVAQSMLMGLFWFACGIEHGSSAVCGNLIGAGLKDEVPRLFRSALKIISGFALALTVVLWFGGDWVIGLFLKNPESLDGVDKLGALTPDEVISATQVLRESLLVVGVYIVIENIRMALYGILRGAGDTIFILWLSVVGTWFMLLVPTYVLMTVWKSPIQVGFGIWLFYAIIMTGLCIVRFRRGTWRHKQILSGAGH